ncbi:MAG: hypothetical protein PVF47_06225 [Anaerolineae bacterium]|jgi:hypothetical protein
MSRRLSLTLLVAALALLVVVPVYALPGKPDFGEHIYADGEAWGTKVTAVFGTPPGNSGANAFDAFYVVTNSNNPGMQLPVGEAAPGNPDYNGGRWATKTVMWTAAGFAAHGTVPILKSQADIDLHAGLGHLMITDGSPGGPGAPPDYFECPLLPVK